MLDIVVTADVVIGSGVDKTAELSETNIIMKNKLVRLCTNSIM